MVSRTLSPILIGLLLAKSASADLQLTPIPSEFERDGVKLTRVAFPTNEGKEIYYRPPLNWTSHGSASELVLTPPNPAQAQATVTKAPLPEPAGFDEETLKKLTDDALASVPPGSSEVELLSADKNPVIIEGKDTFLVQMSYTYYGETYGRSVMFMNRGKEQFRFQLVSRLAEFGDLQAAFLASHFHWENL